MASRPSIPNWRCVSLADLLLELKRRLPDVKNEEQDSLLLALLRDAASMILNYTGLAAVPAPLLNTQVRLAVILYNRLGTEGDKSRTEGDVNRTFDPLPDALRQELLPFRIVKTGGVFKHI